MNCRISAVFTRLHKRAIAQKSYQHFLPENAMHQCGKASGSAQIRPAPVREVFGKPESVLHCCGWFRVNPMGCRWEVRG
jgi:hypothetical protein